MSCKLGLPAHLSSQGRGPGQQLGVEGAVLGGQAFPEPGVLHDVQNARPGSGVGDQDALQQPLGRLGHPGGQRVVQVEDALRHIVCGGRVRQWWLLNTAGMKALPPGQDTGAQVQGGGTQT